MTPERKTLYDQLVVERFTPRPVTRRIVCAGCGNWANPGEPCPACKHRRDAKKRHPK